MNSIWLNALFLILINKRNSLFSSIISYPKIIIKQFNYPVMNDLCWGVKLKRHYL